MLFHKTSTKWGDEVESLESVIAVDFDKEGRTLDEISVEEELALQGEKEGKNEADVEDSDGGGEMDDDGEAVKEEEKRNAQPSAYFNFCKVHREAAKAENPDATFGEISKILGGMWKELDDTEKEEYKAAAEEKELIDAERRDDIIDGKGGTFTEKDKTRKRKKSVSRSL